MDTEMALKMRVKLCMEKLKVSANEMERQCGISHSTISSQVNGKSKLSATVIAELLAYRPDISAEWLLRGTGDMFLDGSSAGESKGNEVQSSTTERVAGGVPSTETYIADLQRQIAELRKDKELLGGLLQQLTGARK